MFCDCRHGFDCLRNGDGATPHPTPGRAPTRDAHTGEEGGVGLFGCGVWVCILSVGFWVGDGRSGTQFQGAGGQPGSAPCSCVTWQTSEGNPRLRASLPPVFSFLPDPLGGVGGCFLAAVAGLEGISEGNDGGDVPRAIRPEFFRQGSYMRSVPFNVVDLPSPGWMGKGHGTRVGSGGLPWV